MPKPHVAREKGRGRLPPFVEYYNTKFSNTINLLRTTFYHLPFDSKPGNIGVSSFRPSSVAYDKTNWFSMSLYL